MSRESGLIVGTGDPLEPGQNRYIEFLELKYLDAVDVELDLAFESIAPLLWRRAGTACRMIERCDGYGNIKPFDVMERYGVFFDPDHWREFLDRLPESACAARTWGMTA